MICYVCLKQFDQDQVKQIRKTVKSVDQTKVIIINLCKKCFKQLKRE